MPWDQPRSLQGFFDGQLLCLRDGTLPNQSRGPPLGSDLRAASLKSRRKRRINEPLARPAPSANVAEAWNRLHGEYRRSGSPGPAVPPPADVRSPPSTRMSETQNPLYDRPSGARVHPLGIAELCRSPRCWLVGLPQAPSDSLHATHRGVTRARLLSMPLTNLWSKLFPTQPSAVVFKDLDWDCRKRDHSA